MKNPMLEYLKKFFGKLSRERTKEETPLVKKKEHWEEVLDARKLRSQRRMEDALRQQKQKSMAQGNYPLTNIIPGQISTGGTITSSSWNQATVNAIWSGPTTGTLRGTFINTGPAGPLGNSTFLMCPDPKTLQSWIDLGIAMIGSTYWVVSDQCFYYVGSNINSNIIKGVPQRLSYYTGDLTTSTLAPEITTGIPEPMISRSEESTKELIDEFEKNLGIDLEKAKQHSATESKRKETLPAEQPFAFNRRTPAQKIADAFTGLSTTTHVSGLIGQ